MRCAVTVFKNYRSYKQHWVYLTLEVRQNSLCENNKHAAPPSGPHAEPQRTPKRSSPTTQRLGDPRVCLGRFYLILDMKEASVRPPVCL